MKGSIENVHNMVDRAFTLNGFKVLWTTPTKGKAEKGSKGASLFLGAAAVHHSVELEIFQAGEGGILRLTKTGSGAGGGLLGMRKANKQFEQLTDTLSSWFKEQGSLINVRKA